MAKWRTTRDVAIACEYASVVGFNRAQYYLSERTRHTVFDRLRYVSPPRAVAGTAVSRGATRGAIV
jgi:hypothetical protein